MEEVQEVFDDFMDEFRKMTHLMSRSEYYALVELIYQEMSDRLDTK